MENTPSCLDLVQAALRAEANQQDTVSKARFFQATEGGYGGKDQFLGIPVPVQRRIARRFVASATAEDIRLLLRSPYHEERLTALLMLNDKFRQARRKHQEEPWVRIYLEEMAYVNNWDLVDSSAHILIGEWLLDKRDRSLLYRLAASSSLWENRIAVIAAGRFIREGDYEDLLRLCTQFLAHPHPLMHKACGWMLRELWKRNPLVVEDFLNDHLSDMPRTMLRYTIEKMPEAERKAYLQH
ncbi:MAG: DNA alkylation repair protein [Haliscomenobacter sp.]